MNFNEIIGQDFLKEYFQKIIDYERVPHTQLFVGKEGVGTLPMAWAFAKYLLCNKNDNCNYKIKKLIHPDLHFIYPTATTSKVKKPDSKSFIQKWRNFMLENPYGSLFDWMKYLEVENKQGFIRVIDAEDIIKKVSIKPYEADYKVFIIWQVEKMNTETVNKLLKILEEPPKDTKFILTAETTDNILPTILSRCQIHHFHPISIIKIKNELIKRFQLDADQAVKIAHQANGNWLRALRLAEHNVSDNDFQLYFIRWVRIAFSAKNNKKSINELIKWSEEIAALGRETQKQFLEFALESFRQAMLLNYQTKDLVYFDFSKNNFHLNNFAPYIHSANIEKIYEEVNKTIYYVERNANAKLLFLELSIKLTKLIHLKEKTQLIDKL